MTDTPKNTRFSRRLRAMDASLDLSEEAARQEVTPNSSSEKSSKRTNDRMSRKRSAEVPVEEEREYKRFASSINMIAEEFVCPISNELPVDPVIAEDGRIYDKTAIKSWFSQCKMEEREVRSPVTNEVMGNNFFTSMQVRNAIKDIVKSGAPLCGDIATGVTAYIQKEEEVASMRQKAESGNVAAMIFMGNHHHLSCDKGKVTEEEAEEAFKWYSGAAEHDDPTGLRMCGHFYSKGIGVEKNHVQGVMMFSQAAILGSQMACYRLGKAYHYGGWSVKKDYVKAAKWYGKMSSSPTDLCKEKRIMDKVNKFLHEFKNGKI